MAFLPTEAVYLGSLIAVSGELLYAFDTLRGQARPNRVTWIFWALGPLVVFAAQLDQQIGIDALLAGLVGGASLLVVLASFIGKAEPWKLKWYDFFCGGLALLGLIAWRLSGEGNVAIACSIASELLATLPTIIKAFKDPSSEPANPYLICLIGAVFVLLAVDRFNFSHAAFAVWALVSNISPWVLIQFRIGERWREKSA